MIDRSNDHRRHGAGLLRWALILVSAGLAGCQAGVLDPQGSVGEANRTILLDSLVIMLAIVVPTITATLVFAWWYRSSNTKARHRPDFAYSGRIELVVWAIPLMVIVLLGGVTWIGAHALDPAKRLVSNQPVLEVQGVSLDWKWLFIYPDQHVASVNQLIIPAGRPIHFSLTSASVMNVFFVPQLGSMIYTMNGMATQLNLDATRPGVFHGQSSHYSGDGFSDMHFDVHAVSADQFTAWVASTHSAGPPLNAASYKDLARQSMNVTPFTYRDADPGLFSQIVTQKIAPGPGPDLAHPGVSQAAERTEH